MLRLLQLIGAQAINIIEEHSTFSQAAVNRGALNKYVILVKVLYITQADFSPSYRDIEYAADIILSGKHIACASLHNDYLFILLNSLCSCQLVEAAALLILKALVLYKSFDGNLTVIVAVILSNLKYLEPAWAYRGERTPSCCWLAASNSGKGCIHSTGVPAALPKELFKCRENIPAAGWALNCMNLNLVPGCSAQFLISISSDAIKRIINIIRRCISYHNHHPISAGSPPYLSGCLPENLLIGCMSPGQVC